jgi:pSer/pThr/pTyr-binding forkhead associated (FHA) protein
VRANRGIDELLMKAELVPENGDPPIPITRDVVVVGRRGYCDVVIDHSSLSKRHCLLVKTDGLLVIRDLISTNGTKVKGQKVRWAALLPDDRLTLGSYKLRVYLGPDEVPGPSELYRSRQPRSFSSTRQPAGVGPGRETRPSPSPPAPGLRFPGQSPSGVAGPAFNLNFPEPSPLEIVVSSSEQDIIASPSKAGRHDESVALFPVVADDSDEIIELD